MKIIATAALIAVASCSPVAAQTPECKSTTEMWDALEAYGESRKSIAIVAAGDAAVETWASVETGTWTIILTSPSGASCIALHGVGWVDVAEPDGEPV